MNLSEFFTPPSLERGGIEHRSSPLKKMPPRAKEGGGGGGGGGGVVVYDSEPMMQQFVRNNHAPQLLAAVQEFKLLESNRERGGGGTRRRAAEENVSSRTSSASSPPATADVTLFVGRNRASYTVCAESLRQSTYFSCLLEKRSTTQEPIIVDCEESVFQNLLLILRYRSFEALPRMSDSELFRLRRELEIHGIELPENMPRKESSSSSSSASSSSSSAGGSGNLSPSSLSAASRCHPMHHQQQQQQLARVLHQQQHSSVSELPDFPEELKDSSKIVLVARIDDDERGRCACAPKTQQQQHSGYWALSFHYRHAFCTGCGKSASAMLSPRFVAEIYMAAAMYYSGENVTNKQKWSVGCDSTCSLKLLNPRPCCLCPCSSLNTNSKTSSSSNSSSSVWAVSTYHSHAFCTRCGESANDQTLVCILLTLRYGGISKSTTRLRRLEHSNGNSGSENVITASSDVVTPLPKLSSASNSRTLPTTTTTEIPRHTRSNKSL